MYIHQYFISSAFFVIVTTCLLPTSTSARSAHHDGFEDTTASPNLDFEYETDADEETSDEKYSKLLRKMLEFECRPDFPTVGTFPCFDSAVSIEQLIPDVLPYFLKDARTYKEAYEKEKGSSICCKSRECFHLCLIRNAPHGKPAQQFFNTADVAENLQVSKDAPTSSNELRESKQLNEDPHKLSSIRNKMFNTYKSVYEDAKSSLDNADSQRELENLEEPLSSGELLVLRGIRKEFQRRKSLESRANVRLMAQKERERQAQRFEKIRPRDSEERST